MGMKNYYQILDVEPDASSDDVRKAFRRLALQYHPDRNPGNIVEAEKKFKELNEAYQVLGYAETRSRYDSLMRLSRYTAKAMPETGNPNGARASDAIFEVIRNLNGKGFVFRGRGIGTWRGCGSRQGGQCRRHWKQNFG